MHNMTISGKPPSPPCSFHSSDFSGHTHLLSHSTSIVYMTFIMPSLYSTFCLFHLELAVGLSFADAAFADKLSLDCLK